MSKQQKKSQQASKKTPTPEIPAGWVDEMSKQNPREINVALVNRTDAKHWHHVKALVEIGADPTYQECKTLLTIIEKGRKDLLSQMLDVKTPSENKHSTLLETALQHHNYHSAVILMDHGIAPDCYAETDSATDIVLNAAELSLRQATERGSLEDVLEIESKYEQHITCPSAVFANAASMYNHIDILNHFMLKKTWPEDVHQFQKDTASEIGTAIRGRENELQNFQVYYTDKESFQPFNAASLTQKPDEDFTQSLIMLAAETRHFTNLITGMDGHGYDDLTPAHLDQKNKFGFNVIEALHKTGEIKTVLDFKLWRNNLETATHMVKVLMKNNLTDGLDIESFAAELNKERYRKQISHKRAPIMRRRTPKM